MTPTGTNKEKALAEWCEWVWSTWTTLPFLKVSVLGKQLLVIKVPSTLLVMDNYLSGFQMDFQVCECTCACYSKQKPVRFVSTNKLHDRITVNSPLLKWLICLNRIKLTAHIFLTDKK